MRAGIDASSTLALQAHVYEVAERTKAYGEGGEGVERGARRSALPSELLLGPANTGVRERDKQDKLHIKVQPHPPRHDTMGRRFGAIRQQRQMLGARAVRLSCGWSCTWCSSPRLHGSVSLRRPLVLLLVVEGVTVLCCTCASDGLLPPPCVCMCAVCGGPCV